MKSHARKMHHRWLLVAALALGGIPNAYATQIGNPPQRDYCVYYFDFIWTIKIVTHYPIPGPDTIEHLSACRL